MTCLDRQASPPGRADVLLSVNGRVTPVSPREHAARHDLPEEFRDRQPSEMEHRFTSTGVKFWKHRDAMESYRAGTGRTVISTHVAPEGRCNLKCGYCSVSERTLHNTIALPTIIDYLTKLKSRGLKAVILTGGGEPTLYKEFNPLGEWILDQGLEIALISNGTQFNRVSDRIMQNLTWLRISMNVFKKWEEKIVVPVDRLTAKTTVGMSICYSGENKDQAFLRAVGGWAERFNISYVRVLPDCMLPQEQLLREHGELKTLFGDMTGGSRFFHQFKVHGAPCQGKCHQAYFRPYLSEAINPATGRPGLVFPCDSVVLNDQAQQFKPLFGLCGPEDILDYLDGKIAQPFDATRDCTGCVFTRNVDMLDHYARTGEHQFDRYADAEVNHANFV
ncbi:MAG: radical SAM protein [Phycisphaerales bacterium]|nr:radical SAM protein [Phycisphaerales bacterium]